MKWINFLRWNCSPSQHNGFAPHETYERQKYEAAEKIGEHGDDCDQIYSECENSFLEQISYLSEPKSFMWAFYIKKYVKKECPPSTNFDTIN